MCLPKLNVFRLDVSIRSHHTKLGKCEEVWLCQAATPLPLHCLVAAVTNNWPLDGEASRKRGDSARLGSVNTGQEERARPGRWVRAPVR